MLYIDDAFAFSRSHGAQPIQATVTPQGEPPTLPGAGVDEFAKALGLPGADSLAGEESMASSLIGASSALCEKWSGVVPVTREYVFSYDLHPYLGKGGMIGTLPNPPELSPWVSLPRHPLQEIVSVTAHGEAVPDYTVDDRSNPPRVRLPVAWAISGGMASLEITAVMGTDPDEENNTMLNSYATAVIWLATYLYENRGCDGGDAMKRSGACNFLRPYRLAGGHLL